MGDGLKLIKGKRHKSSSSLSGVALEGKLSTRKLDIRASIPELEDQFAIAEARCDDLQEKIDLVKVLKRKRKLKRRSSTRMTEQKPSIEAMPLITVRTQPKKKVSQQATRYHRYDVPLNSTRGYLDPATVEQHRMIGQMHGYNQMFKQPQETSKARVPAARGAEQSRPGLKLSPGVRPDGDAGHVRKVTHRLASVQISGGTQDAACCSDRDTCEFLEDDEIFQHTNEQNNSLMPKKVIEGRMSVKSQNSTARRRHVPKETLVKEDVSKTSRGYQAESSPVLRRQPTPSSLKGKLREAPVLHEERSVVELFNKAQDRSIASQDGRNMFGNDKKKGRVTQSAHLREESNDPLNNVSTMPMKKESHTKHPHRVKYRSRRYELPTVASQMKQARMRCYQGIANNTNIPFVVSKSTAPSHNIGVNIQQVLNGIKIQQPLNGIPLTIAHHMGLGHLPTFGHARDTTTHPSLENRQINTIQLGQKLVRLPSYKYNMSFNRLLSLYREGEGMVPRFLRAISRPHYFYTSMYNLATRRDDHDGATSKGFSRSQEAKQSLAEYAALYREYEHVEKCIHDGDRDPVLEQRKEELSKELASREDHIRRVVQEYGTQNDVDQAVLRGSASTTENPYRHSTHKLSVGDLPR